MWSGAPTCTGRRRRQSREKKRGAVEELRFHLLDNRDDAAAEQPPHFTRFPLRREQLRSLKWMQWCEEQPRSFHLVPSQVYGGFGGKHSAMTNFGWQCWLRCREVYDISGGILGDAIGYGKTATTIGLIDSRHSSSIQAQVPAAQAPYFFRSNATLVLVPSNLLEQWFGEFQKFLSGSAAGGAGGNADSCPLRIVAIKSATQLKAMTVRRLCAEADVVLVSYRLLFSPVYRRRLLELSGNFAEMQLSDSSVVRAVANVQSLRSNTRRFRVQPREVGWKHKVESLVQDARSSDVPADEVDDPESLRFPVLEQFWWRRIVFDEFHELEAMGQTVQFESLCNLCGSHRWGLTGTPPTRDLAQISTLAQLFQIGNLPREFVDPELAVSMAQAFLDHFARQNTSSEVLPVQLREHIVDIHPTPEERVIYLQALHDRGVAAAGEGQDPAPVDAALAGGAPTATTEQLLKLCSHFASGADATADAGSECRRLIGVKQKALDKAATKLAEAAMSFELILRLASQRATDAAGKPQPSVEERREQAIEALRRRFSPGSATAGASAADSSSAPPAEPEPTANSVAAPVSGTEAATAEAASEPASTAEQTPSSASSPIFAAIFNALEVARCSTLLELRRKVEATDSKSAGGSGKSALSGAMSKMLAAASPLAYGASRPSRELDEVESQALAVVQSQFDKVVDAFASASRSQSFFAKVLAAMRGEGSEEHRDCSVCLDDDIPCEQLSITACAHVFHTACIRDVVATLGTCPECRQTLDLARDITPLVSELLAADRASGAREGGTAASSSGAAAPGRGAKRGRGGAVAQLHDSEFPELARRSGSKLAAIALRLREISGKGEKAIVFCQWEDLKRKVASALGELGIPHFQLAGNVHQRGEVIRRFQEERGEGSTSVLLLSLESAASGANLTAASHVVFVHPMCAASAERAVAYEAQAIGRCRRWGQEKSEVHCWRFVTRGTVEEAITAAHRKELWEHHLSGADVAGGGAAAAGVAV
mmetsp:Transcript_87401/g.280337  ORF Transcript_87401/g.280337 Transcript_87401/m.280337 type:complete len:1001 (-) Transcript_87401:1164-4166(-)